MPLEDGEKEELGGCVCVKILQFVAAECNLLLIPTIFVGAPRVLSAGLELVRHVTNPMLVPLIDVDFELMPPS